MQIYLLTCKLSRSLLLCEEMMQILSASLEVLFRQVFTAVLGIYADLVFCKFS